MGFCNECNAEYSEGMKFCPQCGAKTPEQLAAESFPNQAKHYVGEAADELWGATKDQDTVKKVAGGAAIGAAAAVIAPIGLATGALIGAGIVAYRHVNKKKNQEK
jgi:uncharacterized membrane protein YvbJ